LWLTLNGLKALLGVCRGVNATPSPRTALSLINEYFGALAFITTDITDILFKVSVAIFSSHSKICWGSGLALALKNWREISPII